LEIVWANAHVGSNPTPSAKQLGFEVSPFLEEGFEPNERPQGGRETTEDARSAPQVNPTPSAKQLGSESSAAEKEQSHGAWLSPVERCVRDAEVPGSNPGAPTKEGAAGIPVSGRFNAGDHRTTSLEA
jgi:hypothetical protein